MKRILLLMVSALAFSSASSQIYLKLNALYAVVGVINPSLEAVVTPNSSLAVDITYSPWRSIRGHHANFGFFLGEYRYYFKEAARGWYVSANLGLGAFDISKPSTTTGQIAIKNGYGKGFGIMAGIGAGYQHTFRERWVVDAFVAFDFMRSWYNGYASTGEIIMNPQGHEDYLHPDPFNGSSEFIPAKVGVSIGYRIFAPKHKRGKKE